MSTLLEHEASLTNKERTLAGVEGQGGGHVDNVQEFMELEQEQEMDAVGAGECYAGVGRI